MKIQSTLLFTQLVQFTNPNNGVVNTLYRFVDKDDGKSFDVFADKSYHHDDSIQYFSPVIAEFNLSQNQKGLSRYLLSMKVVK